MPSTTDPHRVAEARSLALHHAVAARLSADPALLDQVRARVRGWLEDGGTPRPYAEAWARVLEGSLGEICAFLVREDDEAQALRHVTPFLGIIEPRERWRIWREVRERMGAR